MRGMRHLGSLVAGILIAPVAWILIALGQQKSAVTITSWQQSGSFDTADLVLPASYLLAAAILIGLIATLRISPLGSLVAGLFYAGTYVGLFINPVRVRNAVPETFGLFGTKVAVRTPLDNGTLLLVGVALLIAVFSVGRWRRWPVAAAMPAPATETGAPGEAPGSPADLPPGAPNGEPTIAQWPPADPHPWSPATQRQPAEPAPTGEDTDRFTASTSASAPAYVPPAPSPYTATSAPVPPSPAPPAPPQYPPAQPGPAQPGSTPSSLPPDSFPTTADDGERPAAPPTSPWSAPPPRSGQG